MMTSLPPMFDRSGNQITDKDEIIMRLGLQIATMSMALFVTNDMLKYFAKEHIVEGHTHEDGSPCAVSLQTTMNDKMFVGVDMVGYATIPDQFVH